MMDRPWIATASKVLVAAGAVLIFIAILDPVKASSMFWMGLALWPVAAAAKVTRHYFRRDPMPSRSGMPITPQGQPVMYHFAYAAFVAMFSFMTYILVRASIAA